MNFIRIEGPGDAVTRVNPDFAGKKSKRLMTHGRILGSDARLPLSTSYLRYNQKTHHQQPSRSENRTRTFLWFSLTCIDQLLRCEVLGQIDPEVNRVRVG